MKKHVSNLLQTTFKSYSKRMAKDRMKYRENQCINMLMFARKSVVIADVTPATITNCNCRVFRDVNAPAAGNTNCILVGNYFCE